MAFYSRKSPRIPGYDYASTNYYFLTICTNHRKCIFGQPGRLNTWGQVAQQHIAQIHTHYQGVSVDQYVVMPNHVHMILCVHEDGQADVTQIVAQYKAGVTREIRKAHPQVQLWQRSFHDHVIRTQVDYERIWLYIEGNPQCWEQDCFYIDQAIQQGW